MCDVDFAGAFDVFWLGVRCRGGVVGDFIACIDDCGGVADSMARVGTLVGDLLSSWCVVTTVLAERAVPVGVVDDFMVRVEVAWLTCRCAWRVLMRCRLSVRCRGCVVGDAMARVDACGRLADVMVRCDVWLAERAASGAVLLMSARRALMRCWPRGGGPPGGGPARRAGCLE